MALTSKLYWSRKMKKIPRPEYPRMQLRRENAWMNLNGVWDFSIDHGKSGLERGLQTSSACYERKITVPFCPESKLSGIGNKDFMESVWYRRAVTFPEAWAGKRILLHFGAVDFRAEVWLDGKIAGVHIGGSSPFTFDITDFVHLGQKQALVVHAVDVTRGRLQGIGKQSSRYDSYGCSYTRVTGIWQTVWAEAVHPQGIAECAITPVFEEGTVRIAPRFLSPRDGDLFCIEIRAGRKVVATIGEFVRAGLSFNVVIPKVREWSPADPFLYDVTLSVKRGGEIIDSAESYFAMRSIRVEGDRLLLNGRPFFCRFVLDQGFYPAGIWTAPSDRDLKADIERSMAAGFNGARLHQKVFEDRFHYWADRLGYLTWAEYPSWFFDVFQPEAQRNFLVDWAGVVRALRSHPSIIAWTPLNESTANGLENLPDPDKDPAVALKVEEYRAFVHAFVAETRDLDPNRPVNDSSGYVHAETDLWTVHSYRATAKAQKDWLYPKEESRPVACNQPQLEVPYKGQPYLLDEWGGFRYVLPGDRDSIQQGWGYNGLDFSDEKKYLAQISAQAKLFLRLPFAGWCYTQLTDIEQEQNGLYTYDRRPKADPADYAKIFGTKPDWSEW